MQSLPFTQLNLGLFGPDKLCCPHHDDSLSSCPNSEFCGPWCTLGLLLSGFKPSPATHFEPASVWETQVTFTWLLTENIPQASLILPEVLSTSKPNRQWADGGRQMQISKCLGHFADLPSGLELIEDTAWPFNHTPRQRRQPQTGLICNSNQVAQGPSQEGSDTEAPESTHPAVNFRQNETSIQLAPQVAHAKGDFSRHQILMRGIPLCVVSVCTETHS